MREAGLAVPLFAGVSRLGFNSGRQSVLLLPLLCVAPSVVPPAVGLLLDPMPAESGDAVGPLVVVLQSFSDVNSCTPPAGMLSVVLLAFPVCWLLPRPLEYASIYQQQQGLQGHLLNDAWQHPGDWVG